MEKFKTVPITLITGYLGSGKTTLVNYILKNCKDHKIAVIVNDIGEINIDADLIQKGGVVSSKNNDLVALQNGCICCTLKKDLIDQLADLVNSHKFDHILIEASGICEPLPIAQTIDYMESEFAKRKLPHFYKLDAIVSVTDALRLVEEFEGGDSLEKATRGEEDVENLIIQQIEFCDVIILNKASMISPEQKEHVKKVIRVLQPKAKIVESDYCQVDIDEIIDTGLFDFEKAQDSSGWNEEFQNSDNEIDSDTHHEEEEHEHHHHHDHDEDEEHEHHHHHDHDEDGEHEHHHHHHHENGIDQNDDEGTAEEYDIGTWVYYRRRPFNREKFEEWMKKDYGREIIRSKGILYFDEDYNNAFVYESAGKQKTISEYGPWYAYSLSQEEIKYYLENDEEFHKAWDEKYGDRMVKLVFIGQNMDKKALRAELDNI